MMSSAEIDLHHQLGRLSGISAHCLGKKKFESEEYALTELKLGVFPKAYAYPCLFCKKWHIGSTRLDISILREIVSQSIRSVIPCEERFVERRSPTRITNYWPGSGLLYRRLRRRSNVRFG